MRAGLSAHNAPAMKCQGSQTAHVDALASLTWRLKASLPPLCVSRKWLFFFV